MPHFFPLFSALATLIEIHMAIVLTDGSAASAKALDLGTVPGLFVEHDTQQLVIIHGWRDSKDLEKLNAVHGTVDHINKSRVAATSLNYKIEMLKLPPLPTVVEGADAVTNASIAPPAAAPAAPVAAAPPAVGAKTPGKKGTEKQEAPSNEAPPAPPVEAEELDPANKVACYVGERAAHHNCRCIVMGVGTGQQGKNLIVGSVARAVLKRFRTTHNLFYLKQSGPLVRPAAAMRMNVLVIPGSDLSHLRYALSISKPEKKNDRVGVTIVLNNGKPKPQEGVLSVAHAQDDDSAPAPGDVAKECAEILAAHGLVDSQGEDGTSTAADSFPLISYLALDPTNNNPTPKVDEVGNQVVRWFGQMKLDFVVLPPEREGLSEAFLLQCLAAQKPHVLLVGEQS